MISVVDGYVYQEEVSWENVNEGTLLQKQVEGYRHRHGCYPESVHADKIYRTRSNLSYCKQRGIRLSGPALGRRSNDEERNRALRRQQRADEIERNGVEGKFGEGKRCYGLARIMARRADTSESVIGLIFLVMNMQRKLRELLWVIFAPIRRFLSRFERIEMLSMSMGGPLASPRIAQT